MLTFSLGVTRMDRVTIKYIRGIAPAEWLGNKVLYMHTLMRFICKSNNKCLRDLAGKNRQNQFFSYIPACGGFYCHY